MMAAGCGGGDGGSGPDDDEVFGTYTLVRASGRRVPQARIFEGDLGFGALVTTFAQSGSFRISEDGTWAFALHFQQIGTAPNLPTTTIEYDVEDSGTYTAQGQAISQDVEITLDGGTVIRLEDGVLRRTVVYSGIPNVPTTTVVYEFEK
jgi:hypothetical protein